MRIDIQEEKGKGFHLRFPTGLFLNRFTALILPATAKKHGVTLTCRQCVSLIKVIRCCKKKHKDWVLAEVSGADGEKVYIKL